MAKLILGGNEFPLVMTVGVLDLMSFKGYDVLRVPQFFYAENLTWEESIDNGVEFLMMLISAGQTSANVLRGVESLALPDPDLLRAVLTPPQIFDLCDAAIRDSLKRTVEAAPEKKTAAVTESP